MPTRNTLPAAQTHPTAKMLENKTANMISHISGPGGMAIRTNINIGVAGGKSETAFEKLLVGESRTGPKHIIGMINNIMIGVIKL